MIATQLKPISTGMKMPPPFDEDGFLMDANLWNRPLARDMAITDGLGHLGAHHDISATL